MYLQIKSYEEDVVIRHMRGTAHEQGACALCVQAEELKQELTGDATSVEVWGSSGDKISVDVYRVRHQWLTQEELHQLMTDAGISVR